MNQTLTSWPSQTSFCRRDGHKTHNCLYVGLMRNAPEFIRMDPMWGEERLWAQVEVHRVLVKLNSLKHGGVSRNLLPDTENHLYSFLNFSISSKPCSLISVSSELWDFMLLKLAPLQAQIAQERRKRPHLPWQEIRRLSPQGLSALGSWLGVTLPPCPLLQRTLTMSGDTSDCHSWMGWCHWCLVGGDQAAA